MVLGAESNCNGNQPYGTDKQGQAPAELRPSAIIGPMHLDSRTCPAKCRNGAGTRWIHRTNPPGGSKRVLCGEARRNLLK
jgi:hypothetical protein